MGRVWRLALVSVFLSAIALQAQHGSHAQPSDKVVDSAWSELNSSMEKMHGAMASVEPSGTDPQMRRLAQEIITDQQSEIVLMQLWLKQHQPQK